MPAYLTHSVTYRFYYMYLGMIVRRFFFYCPFYLTTGAIQASGLGYNGDGKWNKVVGVYWYEVETATGVIE